MGVKRGTAGLEGRLPAGGHAAGQGVDDGLQVGRGRPAAPADDTDPELEDETTVVIG